jgi:hypothetical protein
MAASKKQDDAGDKTAAKGTGVKPAVQKKSAAKKKPATQSARLPKPTEPARGAAVKDAKPTAGAKGVAGTGAKLVKDAKDAAAKDAKLAKSAKDAKPTAGAKGVAGTAPKKTAGASSGDKAKAGAKTKAKTKTTAKTTVKTKTAVKAKAKVETQVLSDTTVEALGEDLEVEEPHETLMPSGRVDAAGTGADDTAGVVARGRAGAAGTGADDTAEVGAGVGDATLPSGIPTGTDSSFYVEPEYEWPEVARRGKATGFKQLAARIRLDVSTWQSERAAGKGRPSGKGGRSLVVTATLTVVAFLVLATFAIYGIWMLATGSGTTDGSGTDGPGADGQASAQTSDKREKDAFIPELTALPGLSLDDALTLLGEGWELHEEDATGSSSGSGAVGTARTARIVYAPSQSADADGAVIRVVLTDSSQVVSVGFICPMDVLGYPEMGFYDVISDQELLRTALGKAGLAPTATDLATPTQDETAVWRLPDDPSSGLRQETWTFTGRGSGAREDIWMLTVSYDYGDSAGNETNGGDGDAGDNASGSGDSADSTAGGSGDNGTPATGTVAVPLRIMEINIY